MKYIEVKWEKHYLELFPSVMIGWKPWRLYIGWLAWNFIIEL